tara:strand:+ start:173 stop:550 length:378 start_codon:yes stop_codon:yes gene_type:complete
MKKLIFTILSIFLITIIGCAHFPQELRFVQANDTLNKTELLDVAIEVSREMNLPPMTKLDKSNGVVEFGKFGSPVTGTTAQVRIGAKNKVDITVVRGSVYVPLPVKEIADEFQTRFEAKLKALKK